MKLLIMQFELNIWVYIYIKQKLLISTTSVLNIFDQHLSLDFN